MTKESKARQWKMTKGKGTKETECQGHAGLLRGLLLFAHHSRRRYRPLLLFTAVPISLHQRRRSPDVGGPQKVKHCWAAPLIRQEVTHAPLLLPPLRCLLGPRPKFGLLVLPPGTVLEQVVSRLLSTTNVLRVAPPAVVIRSVVPALEVHAREGMPRLELVESGGRPLLRPWRGVGSGLPFFRST